MRMARSLSVTSINRIHRPATWRARHPVLGWRKEWEKLEQERMKFESVRLFVKPFCGWCHEAQEWLDERGIKYDLLDVTTDRAARQEMFDLTGQTLAPVIDVDGEILADFDTDQLDEFWKKLEKSSV